MLWLTISSSASNAVASSRRVSTGEVITSRTGRRGSRPTASTRLRRSRSVTMPISPPSSTTRMHETPPCDMAAAASSIVAPGAVATVSWVTRSSIGVPSTVLPEAA
jgi:hypothetical protein